MAHREMRGSLSKFGCRSSVHVTSPAALSQRRDQSTGVNIYNFDDSCQPAVQFSPDPDSSIVMLGVYRRKCIAGDLPNTFVPWIRLRYVRLIFGQFLSSFVLSKSTARIEPNETGQ